jgi:flavin reductase (DIM6/NTAB) family NADH-FMN oxidoreductase RutF
MEFSPELFGCIIAATNHSFEMIRQSEECVFNLPTVDLTDQVVDVGNTTGASVYKFAAYRLTAGNPRW